MSSLIKNLIVALGIAVVFGGIYLIISNSDEGITAEVDTTVDLSYQTEKILKDITTINSYKMDTSLFDDPRFNALEDYRVDIPDVNSGRRNPFEPIY